MNNHPPIQSSRGTALLLVLGMLSLLTILLVGFLAAVGQDRVSSDFHESGNSARQYADTAVSIVTAQIAEATARADEAWISQPGLLRTFNPQGSVAAYKLYSASEMTVTGAYDPESRSGAEIPADWAGRTDEFVDLNRPVVLNSGTVYPIVDPLIKNDVEGFDLDKSAPSDPSGKSALPMPVRWMYVMKDGSLASPDAVTGDTKNAVARIAFWTDDETCKVNVNTASDGVYYDTPVTNALEDHTLAVFQPVAQEYQRYPGHPAETSLAAVLAPLRSGTLTAATRSQNAAALTPRIMWGGSEGGTNPAWWTKKLGSPDADRLLATIDELCFKRDPSTRKWTADGARTLGDLSGDDLKRLSFCLTTDSRAPELNLFNRPRITLWPFNTELVASPSLLTPEDRLIKFASELGKNKRKLYFQRENAWDPFNDYENIPENQALYGYLQWLSSAPFPASASSSASSRSFENKFGSLGRDQILTEMFDYLRSNVNTMNVAYKPVNGPTYSFPQNHTTEDCGFNDITPLMIRSGSEWTRGIGNGGPALNEFILQFYNKGEHYEKEDGTTVTNPTENDYLVRKVQMVVLMDFQVAVNSLNGAMPRFQTLLSGSEFSIDPNPRDSAGTFINSVQIKVRKTGTSSGTFAPDACGMGFPTSNNLNWFDNCDAQYASVDIFGGMLGLSYGLRCPSTDTAKGSYASGSIGIGKTLNNQATGYNIYPYVSDDLEFRIPLTSHSGTIKPAIEPTVRFNGSPVTLSIDPLLAKGRTQLTAGNLYQRGGGHPAAQQISIPLGSADMPLPLLGPTDKKLNDSSWKNGGDRTDVPTFEGLKDYSKRLQYIISDFVMNTPRQSKINGSVSGTCNQTMDVFRAYHLDADNNAKGDFRLVVANPTVPANWFAPNPNYYASTGTTGSGTTGTNAASTGTASMIIFHGTTLMAPQQVTGTNAASTGGETITVRSGLSSTVPQTLRRQEGQLTSGALYSNDENFRMRTTSRALSASLKANGTPGDFTNGMGTRSDGSFIKGPDLGGFAQNYKADGTTETPYYATSVSRSANATDDTSNTNNATTATLTGLVYSPWKQMPSAVLFGTLPSRALETSPRPWETLLFNPVPNGGKSNHPGWTDLPRDHYWLDFFYMPVVEPYAITENLATNGKINLNTQIAPFTYIRRNTSLHALLRNLKILAIPTADATVYKSVNKKLNATSATLNYRKPLDVALTVDQIVQRLKTGNTPFISASEICEIPMIPQGETASSIETYWSSRQLTGDDQREAPYNHLYPRLTTRSNTYKIHFWTQTIKGKPGHWTVTGEYRGSQTLERYLDASSRGYGDEATTESRFPALTGTDANGIPYYKFRILEHHQFAP